MSLLLALTSIGVVSSATLAQANGTSIADTLAAGAVASCAATQATGITTAITLAGACVSAASATQAASTTTASALASSAVCASVAIAAAGASSTAALSGVATVPVIDPSRSRIGAPTLRAHTAVPNTLRARSTTCTLRASSRRIGSPTP